MLRNVDLIQSRNALPYLQCRLTGLVLGMGLLECPPIPGSCYSALYCSAPPGLGRRRVDPTSTPVFIYPRPAVGCSFVSLAIGSRDYYCIIVDLADDPRLCPDCHSDVVELGAAQRANSHDATHTSTRPSDNKISNLRTRPVQEAPVIYLHDVALPRPPQNSSSLHGKAGH